MAPNILQRGMQIGWKCFRRVTDYWWEINGYSCEKSVFLLFLYIFFEVWCKAQKMSELSCLFTLTSPNPCLVYFIFLYLVLFFFLFWIERICLCNVWICIWIIDLHMKACTVTFLIITLRGCLCSSSRNFPFSCFACEFDVFEKLEEEKNKQSSRTPVRTDYFSGTVHRFSTFSY